jgi:hypothetical protein
LHISTKGISNYSTDGAGFMDARAEGIAQLISELRIDGGRWSDMQL